VPNGVSEEAKDKKLTTLAEVATNEVRRAEMDVSFFIGELAEAGAGRDQVVEALALVVVTMALSGMADIHDLYGRPCQLPG
jgi:hypothetical protein